MGDHLRTYIKFGGDLKRSQLPRLLEVVEGEGFEDRTHELGSMLSKDYSRQDRSVVITGEANNGLFEDLENCLVELGLSWRAWVEASNGADAHLIWWMPGMEAVRISTASNVYPPFRMLFHQENLMKIKHLLETSGVASSQSTLNYIDELCPEIMIPPLNIIDD